MGPAGGVELSEHLDELEAGLREYYGAINEIRMGLNAQLPPKPQALVYYETCKALGLPLVDCGVMGQPYIWLQEVAVITEQEMLFKLLEERQRNMSE